MSSNRRLTRILERFFKSFSHIAKLCNVDTIQTIKLYILRFVVPKSEKNPKHKHTTKISLLSIICFVLSAFSKQQHKVQNIFFREQVFAVQFTRSFFLSFCNFVVKKKGSSFNLGLMRCYFFQLFLHVSKSQFFFQFEF